MPDDALPRFRPTVDRQAHGVHPEAEARHYTSSYAHPRIPEASRSGWSQRLRCCHGASGHSGGELDEARSALLVDLRILRKRGQTLGAGCYFGIGHSRAQPRRPLPPDHYDGFSPQPADL
eukprot:4828484-Pleurochrysis_carterae.AAC.1